MTYEELLKISGVDALHRRERRRLKHALEIGDLKALKGVSRKLKQYSLDTSEVDKEIARLMDEMEQARRDARDVVHREGESVPEGKVVISGVVLGVKWQTTDYGRVLRMLIQDDRGFRVWGSRPSGSGFWKEDHVTFTAHVSVSPDDDKFGYFKYPSKYTPIYRRRRTNGTN